MHFFSAVPADTPIPLNHFPTGGSGNGSPVLLSAWITGFFSIRVAAQELKAATGTNYPVNDLLLARWSLASLAHWLDVRSVPVTKEVDTTHRALIPAPVFTALLAASLL